MKTFLSVILISILLSISYAVDSVKANQSSRYYVVAQEVHIPDIFTVVTKDDEIPVEGEWIFDKKTKKFGGVLFYIGKIPFFITSHNTVYTAVETNCTKAGSQVMVSLGHAAKLDILNKEIIFKDRIAL